MSPAFKERLKKWNYRAIALFLRPLEIICRRFITFHLRPIYSKDILVERIGRDYSDYAIVMQGPLLLAHSFTFETLTLYQRYFPGALLILSTWEGEDARVLEQIQRLGVEILLNKKPKNPGPGNTNINLQVVSSGAGLSRALQARKIYAFKTRTDTRLYNLHSLTFMTDLLKQFPLPTGRSLQKGRLISSRGSLEHLYGISDLLVFGYTEDVLLFFSIDLLPDNFVSPLADAKLLFRPDQYLFFEFLRKVGAAVTYTPEDSLRMLALHALIIDERLFDWYWHKYDYLREYRTFTSYRRTNYTYSAEFADWLALYRRYDN